MSGIVLNKPASAAKDSPCLGKNYSEILNFSEQVALRGVIPDMSTGGHVLSFFSTWCGPCCMSIPSLMKRCLMYKNLTVSQMSPEEVAKLEKFYATVKVPYNVLKVTADLWEELSNAFQLNGIPFITCFDDGICIFAGHPSDPDLEPIIKSLNAKHAKKD